MRYADVAWNYRKKITLSAILLQRKNQQLEMVIDCTETWKLKMVGKKITLNEFIASKIFRITIQPPIGISKKGTQSLLLSRLEGINVEHLYTTLEDCQ